MKKMLCSLMTGLLAGVLLFDSVAVAAPAPARYQVASGDTFYLIARRSGVTLSALRAANPQVSDPARIHPGQWLTLPAAGQVIDWMAPSGGAYPAVKPGAPIWIDVSLNAQRVYIKQGDRTIYAMITSSGLEPGHGTPRGTFTVERERGEWFYSWKYREGAKYWVSFKNHGEYLFHTVVMDQQQQVIPSEARKLGTKASHGCLRLTVADARWIYEHIPTGTKVVIHE